MTQHFVTYPTTESFAWLLDLCRSPLQLRDIQRESIGNLHSIRQPNFGDSLSNVALTSPVVFATKKAQED
jgi:hypothetical protein